MPSAKGRRAETFPLRLLERRLLNVLAYGISPGDDDTCVSESPGQELAPFLARLENKGCVLDLSVIPLRRFISAELGAPVLDLRLKPGETDRCPVPKDMDLSRLEGLARRLAETKQQDPTWSGLDAVSLATYLGYWRAKGARVGRKIAGRIVWLRSTSKPTLDP